MPRITRTPRQQIFQKLEQMRDAAVRAMEKDPDAVDFDDLESVLLLARHTVEVLRNYKINRSLLLSIYTFLVSREFNLTRLDQNWDGQGKLPTRELPLLVGDIAEVVADRVPNDENPIESPFTGERTTCAALRMALHTQSSQTGFTHAAAVLGA